MSSNKPWENPSRTKPWQEMSADKPWEDPSRTKPWQEMNADEKAEWLRAELKQVNSLNARLQQMSSLYAMLSSQVQEIGRAVKSIEKRLEENR